MAKKLTRLTVRETSLVDKGAGDGVRVVMSKVAPLTAEQPLPPKVEEYLKREFTTEHRRSLARQGKAMPDGGYPIENVDDLHNAIQAIGRAKKPGKTKSHIVGRARALGATHVLPDKWVKKTLRKNTRYVMDSLAYFAAEDGGEDFAKELAEIHDACYIDGQQEDFCDATCVMKQSVDAIMDDPEVVDKAAAVRESFGQYLDHVSNLRPEGGVSKLIQGAREKFMKSFGKQHVATAAATPLSVDYVASLAKVYDPDQLAQFVKAYTSVGQSDTDNRRSEITSRGKTVTIESEGDESPIEAEPPMTAADKETKKVLKHLFTTLRTLRKADKKSADYMDHEDNDMDDEDCKKFLNMSVAERHAYIEANPVTTLTQKRLENLPADVRKAIEDGKTAVVELAKRADAETLATVTKRLSQTGLASSQELGPHVVTLTKASSEATEALLKAIEQFTAAARNQGNVRELFRTVGKGFETRNGQVLVEGGEDAYTTLEKMAQAQVDEGKAPTVAVAFSKFYESTNPEIRALIRKMKDDGSAFVEDAPATTPVYA